MQPHESRSNVTDTLDRLKAALADRYAIERFVQEIETTGNLQNSLRYSLIIFPLLKTGLGR